MPSPPAIYDLFSASPQAQPLSRLQADQPGNEPPSPVELHPTLWRAHQLARHRGISCPSGFGKLDAELPGGGWPAQTLSELLLPHPGIGEIRLLAPALASVQRQSGLSVMLFDPPAELCSWTLSALGIRLRQLVVVRSTQRLLRNLPAPPRNNLLWALEQSLKSGEVGAVLAWAPLRMRPEALRRLQLAALSHPGPAFLLREPEAQFRPSAAPLRLCLSPAGPDELSLSIVKRRGPPLLQPMVLSLPPVLTDTARTRALSLARQHAPSATAFTPSM